MDRLCCAAPGGAHTSVPLSPMKHGRNATGERRIVMSLTVHSHNSQRMCKFTNLKQKPECRRILIKATRSLMAIPIASIFLLQAESTSTECQVNDIVFKVNNLTNQEHARYNLRPLQLKCRLITAAQSHTADMVEMRRIGHIGSDGSKVGSRVEKVGYRYRSVGENVASGQKTPEAVVRA